MTVGLGSIRNLVLAVLVWRVLLCTVCQAGSLSFILSSYYFALLIMMCYEEAK